MNKSRALWVAALATSIAGLAAAISVVGREARTVDVVLLFSSGVATGITVVSAIRAWRDERRAARRPGGRAGY